MDKEETIKLIKGRIMDEYRKHPTLDWAEIAARKLYSQWSEYFEESRQADVISCVCPNEIKTGTVSIQCCNLCGKPDEDWWGKH